MDWLWVAPRAVVAIAAVILFTRMNGLRSFSKMSSFDFALTIALGSVIASAVLSVDQSLWRGLLAMAAIFAIQKAVALGRQRLDWFRHATDNEPELLMRGSEILTENLRRLEVTEEDLFAKLREANVLSLDQVRAVVLETTGDISVLHGPADGRALEDRLLCGVKTGEG